MSKCAFFSARLLSDEKLEDSETVFCFTSSPPDVATVAPFKTTADSWATAEIESSAVSSADFLLRRPLRFGLFLKASNDAFSSVYL